ncbi:MAG: hypothetical protein LUF25_05400 [Phascolarctobacterium sp.]|nr:hypothetical protein [Phascolarctobacterium sp.]
MEKSVIENITAGFLVDGDNMTEEEKEHETTGKELGGAIYNYSNSNGTTTIGNITGTYFIENEAGVLDSENNGYGGAIFNYYGGIGTISDSYFLENKANGGQGGAIYNYVGTVGSLDEDGNVTTGISGSYFVENTATI